MGVPKFYRWLSERYPCLSQTIKEHKLPDFDNLYLDMNGIIHPCSHPDVEDPHFQISEEEIFQNIFNYIEILFRIIKPQKHLFLAVDGCAPRAKMNQQRGRRFRTAKEMEEAAERALAHGEVLPTEQSFDTNSITPGTEFMERLHEHLKFFVKEKISTDPSWGKCTVHLSGHDVPGEGEHKIMDFIRYCKSQPNYDVNTRHCLYGLDADLIMLGLSSHEPHFSLLREEVRFGERGKDLRHPEMQVFHLLHIPLLREYIEMEFNSLKGTLPFDYNIERVIDDWVFLSFLVGNDFVPHLPHMHINHESLPLLYRIYKDFLPTATGYLNNGGTINLERLKEFFSRISQYEQQIFDNRLRRSCYTMGELLDEDSSPDANPPPNVDEQSIHGQTEFKTFKQEFYQKNFNVDFSNRDDMRRVYNEYVIALQWISHYYFNGVQSWSWFYPYHYSPYLTDLLDFDVKEIHLDMGVSFSPYEQLLAVLPSASHQLLPKAFQGLLLNSDSPILDFYPTDFDTDMNGKKHDYEAVVLIPFIEEKRLQAAIADKYSDLTDAEKKRDMFGLPTVYGFAQDGACKISEITRDRYSLSMCEIRKGLLPGVRLGVNSPGFPTFKHLQIESMLGKDGVKLFRHKSKFDNTSIKIFPPKDMNIMSIARNLVGKVGLVEWPYQTEALITSVMNNKVCYSMDENNCLITRLVSNEENEFVKSKMEAFSNHHLHGRGINLGGISIVVEATPLLGKKFVYKRSNMTQLEDKWSVDSNFYPLQTVVKKPPTEATCRIATDSLFTLNTPCVLLTKHNHGCLGKVTHFNRALNRVSLTVEIKREPNFVNLMIQSLSPNYVSSYSVARKLGVHTETLARITGNTYIDVVGDFTSMTYDIGLKMKYTRKNLEMAGYAHRSNFGWVFSEAALAILQEYKATFPDVFHALEASRPIDGQPDNFVFHSMFPGKSAEYLQRVCDFLKTLPCYSQDLIKCQSNILSRPVVENIRKTVQSIKESSDAKRKVKLKVSPGFLLRSSEPFYGVPADRELYVFDRVVNINSSVVVPFGARGTIIGVHGVPTNGRDAQLATDLRYEVLFDEMMSLSRRQTTSGFLTRGTSLLRLSQNHYHLPKRTHIPFANKRRAYGVMTCTKQRTLLPVEASKRALLRPAISGHFLRVIAYTKFLLNLR